MSAARPGPIRVLSLAVAALPDKARHIHIAVLTALVLLADNATGQLRCAICEIAAKARTTDRATRAALADMESWRIIQKSTRFNPDKPKERLPSVFTVNVVNDCAMVSRGDLDLRLTEPDPPASQAAPLRFVEPDPPACGAESSSPGPTIETTGTAGEKEREDTRAVAVVTRPSVPQVDPEAAATREASRVIVAVPVASLSPEQIARNEEAVALAKLDPTLDVAATVLDYLAKGRLRATQGQLNALRKHHRPKATPGQRPAATRQPRATAPIDPDVEEVLTLWARLRYVHDLSYATRDLDARSQRVRDIITAAKESSRQRGATWLAWMESWLTTYLGEINDRVMAASYPIGWCHPSDADVPDGVDTSHIVTGAMVAEGARLVAAEHAKATPNRGTYEHPF